MAEKSASNVDSKPIVGDYSSELNQPPTVQSQASPSKAFADIIIKVPNLDFLIEVNKFAINIKTKSHHSTTESIHSQ